MNDHLSEALYKLVKIHGYERVMDALERLETPDRSDEIERLTQETIEQYQPAFDALAAYDQTSEEGR